MSYSLKQAAEATGKTKTTILRAIQTSKISATKDALGAWQIDPAELHRVYKPVVQDVADAVSQTQRGAPAELYERLLAEKDAVIADLRADRDQWREQAQRLALTDQRPIITAPPATGPERHHWWQRRKATA